MKQSDCPSAARWSGAKSLGWPSAHQAPASAPQSWAPRMLRRPPSAPCAAAASASGAPSSASLRSTPSALSRSRRACTRGDGHTSSATQRPGTSSIQGAGGTDSCIHTRSIGSSAMPVSTSFSQWSHQRSASWRKPIAGPGVTMCGNECGHGPMSPLRGPDSPSSRRSTLLV